MTSLTELLSDLSVATSARILIAVTIVLAVFGYEGLFKREHLPSSWQTPRAVSAWHNWPIIGDLRFWNRRWDLFVSEAALSDDKAFRFNVGKTHVVGLTGDAGRRGYFTDSHLNLSQGYGFLLGLAPAVNKGGEHDSTTTEFTAYFTKRLKTLLTSDALNDRLPVLVNDVSERLEGFKQRASGIIKPFEELPDLVFQLTMRTVGCDDIAGDHAWCSKTRRQFEKLDESFDVAVVIAPWLPSLSSIKRFIYGTQLYMSIDGVVKGRRKSGIKHNDPLQVLVDAGDDSKSILGFLLNALFAGQINSSINASYLIYCLSLDNASRQKVLDEVRSAAQEYCTSDKRSASLPEQLSTLSLETWETKFPFIDKCLKESIRHMLQGSSLRKNISSKPLKVGDAVIPPNGIAVWRFAESHLDPSIFPDPECFDPSRFEEENLSRLPPNAFVGWGSGRHPCGGIRFAKLEMFIMVALFLAYFPDAVASDAKGAPIWSGDENSKRPRTTLTTENYAKPVDAEHPLPPLMLDAQSTTAPVSPVYLNLRPEI